jgi:LacI family transcriptional regulator
MTGRNKRVTIKDVAEYCGLAPSTISNALARRHYVTPETQERVRAAADKLGYRASALARSLRLNRTLAVGVLVADVANPSVADHLRGIDQVAVEEGCSVILSNTDGSLANQERLMQTMVDRRVDGMILISQHADGEMVRSILHDVPFVLMHRRSYEYQDSYVGSDNRQTVEVAVRHLVSLGHRNIAFLHGPEESSSARERLEAFRKCVVRFGLSPDPGLIMGGDYSFEVGYECAKNLLVRPMRPTAIMASNDINALGILDAAHQLGLSVPAELSVVGSDDIAFAKFAAINLTTVRPPRREMGVRAAQVLMRLIGGTAASETHIFPSELVVRGSTSSPS